MMEGCSGIMGSGLAWWGGQVFKSRAVLRIADKLKLTNSPLTQVSRPGLRVTK
jgi:hypothetical protein